MTTSTAAKIDMAKEYKADYAAPAKPALLEVRKGSYLAVRGEGGPGGTLFQSRIGALYAMAYTVKFQSKLEDGRDFTVSRLEGLWGVDGQSPEELATFPKESWRWRLLIRVPSFVRAAHLTRARAKLREKGKEGDFDAVELQVLGEGLSVQMLHVGPYEEEARTLEVMRAFAAEKGLVPHLSHHEVYMSDPRRVPAAKLKTLLRMPVRKG